jgi:hypothetical protein
MPLWFDWPAYTPTQRGPEPVELGVHPLLAGAAAGVGLGLPARAESGLHLAGRIATEIPLWMLLGRVGFAPGAARIGQHLAQGIGTTLAFLGARMATGPILSSITGYPSVAWELTREEAPLLLAFPFVGPALGRIGRPLGRAIMRRVPAVAGRTVAEAVPSAAPAAPAVPAVPAAAPAAATAPVMTQRIIDRVTEAVLQGTEEEEVANLIARHGSERVLSVLQSIASTLPEPTRRAVSRAARKIPK